MEGMRGFAVSLVFLVHYVALVRPWIGDTSLLELTHVLHTIGNTGVDLFFVLSGYLIYQSLISRPQSYLRFMSRRVARIYPAFLVVFVLYIVLSFAFPEKSKIPGPVPDAIVYLLQNFLLLPGLFPVQPMITVAWSLSYEMFYYLAIPLVIVVFRLRERSPAWRIGFFSCVAVATLVYCGLLGGHVRLVMFISGVLLYEAMDREGTPSVSSLGGLVALAIGLLATLVPTGFCIKVGALFVSFFLLCLACFRDPSASLARAFSWTPLRWLGNMSYSYYLLHGLTLQAAFLVLAMVLPTGENSPWLFWALLPPMFTLTLIPSAMLFLAIERPLSLTPRRKLEHHPGPFPTAREGP